MTLEFISFFRKITFVEINKIFYFYILLKIEIMSIEKNIETINKLYKSGISKDNSFQAKLKNTIRVLVQDAGEITNEPTNEINYENPDYS